MLRNHPDQKDLFKTPVYESREAAPAIDPDRFRYRIKTAMSEVLRKGELDRHFVASEISRILGSASFSKGMLDAYTSPSKTDHDISLLRFKAFVRVTEAKHLWDMAVSDDGLIILQGDEARLAEIARLQQEQREIATELRKLRSKPVNIKRKKT